MGTRKTLQAVTLIIGSLLVTSNLIHAESNPRFTEGFGGAVWGMNRVDVREAFHRHHDVRDTTLSAQDGIRREYYYVDTVGQMEWRVFPEFVHDSFYSAMLMFESENMQMEEVVSAYKQIAAALESRLCAAPTVCALPEVIPLGADEAWLTTWDRPETMVSLFVGRPSNLGYTLGITYTCKELAAAHTDSAALSPEQVDRLTHRHQGIPEKGISPSDENKSVGVSIPLEEKMPKADEFVAISQMPTETRHEAPVYPEKAKAAGVSGVVWVQALIGKDGNVSDARILKPSGMNVGFEEAALEAAYKNRYRPAIQNDAPVAVWISYQVEFKPDK